MMKILIIGGNSFVGNALKEKLNSAFSITTAGRNNADINLDLTNWTSDVKLSKPFDIVINVAANFGGDTSYDMMKSEIVNNIGSLKVAEIAKKSGAKHLIHISTISVYYTDNHPYYTIYSLSKKHAEESLKLYCSKFGLNLTILRPSQLFDEKGLSKIHQPLLFDFYEKAKNDTKISIFGNHDALRNYVHINDFINICSKVITLSIFGTYNCIYPEYTSLSNLATYAFNTFGNKVNYEFITTAKDIPDIPVLVDNQLYNIINYVPRISIEKGYKLMKDFEELNI